MAKRRDIERYSADDLEAKRRRGESRTDWAKVDAMTAKELEASIAADPDDVHEEPDWSQAVKGLPPRKEHINIRVDADVLSWFRETGKGYQTRMNNVRREPQAHDAMTNARTCLLHDLVSSAHENVLAGSQRVQIDAIAQEHMGYG